MLTSLDDLRVLLLKGQKLSKQTSYQRGPPAKKSLPFLIEARTALRAYTGANQHSADGWRLRSRAEECLLDYKDACDCLERAIALSSPALKNDLKRLYLLRENLAHHPRLELSPDQLAALGSHLDTALAAIPCDHTLNLTRAWLDAHHIPEPTSVLKSLRNAGGYCDCEVLLNVVPD